MGAGHRTRMRRNWLERARARLAAVVAISLVAASGGLLFEMNRQAHAQPLIPAALAGG